MYTWVGDIVKGILKKIKKYREENSKGFTLIEMIGVIVIMGLIMIVVFPTLSKMIHNNNNQEYTNYYSIIEEGAHVYAGTLTDKLGSSKYSGCAEITLDELINNGYVQAFDDKKVTCKTGSGNIKIRNDKGNITVNFQLNCSTGGKNEFITGTNDNNACNAYVMEEEINLKTKIDTAIPTSNKQVVGTDVYINGSNPNNYVWYSGKLWRVVSYSNSTEVVKAVTVDSITSIYFNHNNSSSYLGSDVETWLNNDFLTSLKEPQLFLASSSWNATNNTNTALNPSSNDKIVKEKVGLINTYEYGRISGWYGSGKYWLISEGTGANSLISNSGSVTSVSSTSMNGVRPVVTFASDTLVHSGSGTSSNPYIIDNSATATGKSGDAISSRYSGEYVNVNGSKYRIVSTDGENAKVIGISSQGKYRFSDNHYDYASSELRTKMEDKIKSNLITNGDFCADTINNGSIAYQSSKCLTPDRVNNSINIGIPKIGDLFTSNISGINTYWTINPNTEIDGSGTSYNATMNIINSDGSVGTSIITGSNDTVVVFYLDSSVKITGGKGTISSPYTLSK